MIHFLPQPKWDEKNKRWILRIQYNGKRKAFTSSLPRTAGKNECREKASKWLDTFDTNESVLFADAFERFLNYYYDRFGNSGSYRQHVSLAKNHILPRLGSIRCGDLRIEDYQSVLSDSKPITRVSEYGKEFRKTDTLSRKYLKNIKNTLMMFHKWAQARGYTKLQLQGELYIPKEAPTKGRNILQLNQIACIFKEPTGMFWERAFMFEILTGVRPGELLGLRIEDYDADTGIIHIRRAINATNEITPGKNARAQRDMALPDKVCQILEEQIATANQLHSEWIFCQPSGQHGTQAALRQAWRRLCKAHGLPADITPYSLRHTFYTHTEAFLPERMTKMIFGHSEKTDSHALYGNHVIEGELEESRKKLEVTPIYKAVE
jgi:site-specific recombinase XerD